MPHSARCAWHARWACGLQAGYAAWQPATFGLANPGSSDGSASIAVDSTVHCAAHWHRRWDLRASSGPEGEWAMEVAAIRDIAAGEELLLSYGELAKRLQLGLTLQVSAAGQLGALSLQRGHSWAAGG